MGGWTVFNAKKKKISEKVTAEDIQRVANRMLRSKLSLAGYGTLANLPDYENIQNSLLGKVGKLRRFSFFG